MKEVFNRIKQSDNSTDAIVAHDKTIHLLKADGLKALHRRLSTPDPVITYYIEEVQDTHAYSQVVPLELRYRIVTLIKRDK